MSNKKENEELQSRREFFKQAAKVALPVVGAAIVASVPFVKSEAQYGCAGSCGATCINTCSGGCQESCMGTCRGCQGTCSGTCGGNCSGQQYF